MDQSSNKTIMCCVFFLDIVGYSKRSVTGQISLKERFNSYLSASIRDVPLSDRIILDTGDGAAINFMGDIEDALKAALSMRASMLHEDPNIEPPLLVRMGINLGPVRLVRDLNGLPNIVGDGINVAQRVMGFADASQILVSRSYYDAVSRLSPKYAGMFHYQGARTDKHVREHEVYAIGYPGDKSTRPFVVHDGAHELPQLKLVKMLSVLTHKLADGLGKIEQFAEILLYKYNAIESKKRPLYVALLGIPVVLLFAFSLKSLVRENVVPQNKIAEHVVKIKPQQAAVNTVSDVKNQEKVLDKAAASAEDLRRRRLKEEQLAQAHQLVIKRPAALTHQEKAAQAANVKVSQLFGFTKQEDVALQTTVSLKCSKGSLLFIDGIQKGRVGNNVLNVVTSAGKHVIIVILPNQKLSTYAVKAVANQRIELNPSICN